MDSTAGREQAAPARAGAGPGQDAGTALSGPWLGLARLTWVALVALTLTLAAGGFAVAFRHPETAALDVTREAVAQVGLSSDVLLLALFRLGPMVVFTAASLIIFRRRSDDPVALVVALALVTLGATGSRSLYALYQAQPPLRPAVLLVWHVGVFSCVLLLALFPSGRFVPRWTRLLTLAAVPALALFPELPEALQTLPTRPDGLAPWRWRAMTLLVVGLYAAGVAAQVHRYRRVSGPTERLQTKWVMSAIGAWLAVGVFAPGAVSLVEGRTVWLGWLRLAAAVTGCLIPIAIGVAILRHHLWRIDLILNRTLVYVPLTAILGGLYAASITLFQRLFVALTGSQSDAAIVMTTLVLAAAFTPVKNALQAAVDARFKQPPDATRSLRELGEEVRAAFAVVDPRRLACRLLTEAAAALRADSGAVYLGPDGRLDLVSSHGEWREAGAAIRVPLGDGGARVGLLCLGPRSGSPDYTARDREALAEAAAIVADAIRESPLWEGRPAPEDSRLGRRRASMPEPPGRPPTRAGPRTPQGVEPAPPG